MSPRRCRYLAHRILREAYKRERVGGEMIMSTALTGLPRVARLRAIKKLVEFGLIEIEQHGNQAARITSLLNKWQACVATRVCLVQCICPNWNSISDLHQY